MTRGEISPSVLPLKALSSARTLKRSCFHERLLFLDHSRNVPSPNCSLSASGLPTNSEKDIVPNCLPNLPSNKSRLSFISACCASYFVRASGMGPRYLWWPKSYHHTLPRFLTVKEHHLRFGGCSHEGRQILHHAISR